MKQIAMLLIVVGILIVTYICTYVGSAFIQYCMYVFVYISAEYLYFLTSRDNIYSNTIAIIVFFTYAIFGCLLHLS